MEQNYNMVLVARYYEQLRKRHSGLLLKYERVGGGQKEDFGYFDGYDLVYLDC